MPEAEPAPEPTPELPPITQEGKNTFGFLLNGEVWLPKAATYMYAIKQQASYYQGKFILVGNRVGQDKNIDEKLNITLDAPVLWDTGTFVLKNPGKNAIGAWYWNNIHGFEYKTDSIHTGILHITRFDLEKRIVSGTFNMVMMGNENTPDSVIITDGRFDMKF